MTISLMLFSATFGIAYQSSDSVSGKDLFRRGLRGNKAYSVSVVLTGPTRTLGLYSSQVGEQIEARLRQARISITSESDGVVRFPKLHLQLDVVGPTSEGCYAVSIRSEVQDTLATVPRRGSEWFLGNSYGASRIFLADGEQGIRGEVRLQVDGLLDQFINDHLEMNSQDQTRSTPK